MRSSFIRNIRPLLPVIVGLFIGVSISIFRAPLSTKECIHVKKDHYEVHINSIKEHSDEKFYSNEEINRLGYTPMSEEEAERYRNDRIYAPPIQDSIEDFEPRIIMDPELKPKVAADYEKNKKVVRPRLLKTELGIRERLVSAVITSQSSLTTMGFAMNRTFSHHMQNVIFFTGTDGIQDVNQQPSNMNILTIATPDENLLLIEILAQLFTKYGETYDWFFITTDTTYSEANGINELIDHISINRRLYLGKPVKYDSDVTYCDLSNGIIISRLLFVDFYPFLKKCRRDKNFESIQSADVWLGKCIKLATRGAVDCVNKQDEIFYHTYDLPLLTSTSLEDVESEKFDKSLTVSHVKSPRQMYEIHQKFAQIQVDNAYKDILDIQEEIKSLESKLPAGSGKLTWPIGINPPFRPTNRWDIIPWDYFTEDYTLTCPGEIPRCELNGIDKLDVQNVMQVALKRLNEKYNPQGLILQKKKLINGYRRYDPQRGMEYVLDILLNVIVEGDKEEIEVNHRIDLLRPLTQAEIVPMPFVTESSHINVIVWLTQEQRHLFTKFMDNFAKTVFATSEKASLTVVFIYDGKSASHLKLRDNDIYVEQKKLLNEYESKFKNEENSNKLIPWISIKTELPSQMKIMDIETKKYSDDSLLLITSPSANINAEFLNRCRMNTIKGWQAFFPIPFSRYNPDILYKDSDSPPPEQIDIKPINGHFDVYSFDEVSIYNDDYIQSRNLLSASISAHETQMKMNEASDMLDIYDLLIKYSQLHVFRAVEPQLVKRYAHRTCDQLSGNDIYHRCIRSNAEGLASRSQLAMQLFPED